MDAPKRTGNADSDPGIATATDLFLSQPTNLAPASNGNGTGSATPTVVPSASRSVDGEGGELENVPVKEKGDADADADAGGNVTNEKESAAGNNITPARTSTTNANANRWSLNPFSRHKSPNAPPPSYTSRPQSQSEALDIKVHSRDSPTPAHDPSATSTKANGKESATATEDAASKTTLVEQPKPVGLLELFRFTTKSETILNVIGLVAAVAAGAAQPLMSLLFGNLTQAFVNFGMVTMTGNEGDIQAAANNFRKVASKDAGFLAVIGLGMFAATYVMMYTWVYTAEMTAKRIRERYLKAVLRQDIAFFDNVGAGEVATRIMTDTHLVQQGISEKVALVVMFSSSFVTGFVLAYIRSWRLALALSTILPCIGITGAVMNRFMGRYLNESLQHIATGGSLAEEVISTIRTAHAFSSQRKLSSLYNIHLLIAHVAETKSHLAHGVGLACFFFVIYSAYALAFDFGTTLIERGEADAGIIVNVFIAILIGSFSLALLAPEMQAISHGRAAAAKLFATIDRVPPIDSQSDSGLKPATCTGHITLENVSFSYPSRPDVPIVQNLTLDFPAGKTAALVGASGSGKSTVINLVERFYDPLQGRVMLDGVDVRELNVRWLRGVIGLVSQEPVLFATSIRGNVEHGLIGTGWEHEGEEEKMRMVREACRKANADGFISKLPLGYDTMVGERGFLLSGGQKQRIAIARAIVSDPKILLLDEATSALDTQSEGIVQDALDKASAGRTTITIAHRLSTIMDAERIWVMGEGRVRESGTHAELIRREGGAYAQLVVAQRLREMKEKEKETVEGEEGEGEEEEVGEKGDVTDVDEKKSLGALPGTSSRSLTRLNSKASNGGAPSFKEDPIGRTNTSHSLASQLIEQRRVKLGVGADGRVEGREFSMYYIFKRIGGIESAIWRMYAFGSVFAILTGMVYPAFGIVYAQAISDFQSTDHKVLRFHGDRNALWFFIIALLSMCTIGIQNYVFGRASANVTHKIRALSFDAILRQDIAFFDRDQNSTGSLTSSLSDNAQKVNGLVGVTLGVIVQSCSTLVTGSIIGLIFNWKLALVGIACYPLIVSAGYIRLQVVVLKDQKNKKAHEESAQLACEAAGAVRTVASLTREDDCLRIYSESLEEPLRRTNRTAIYSNLIYALSQSMTFYVIALVFYYGSKLVAERQLGTTGFFVCMFSVIFGAVQAGNVFAFVPDISSAKGAATDVINLLDSRPEIDAESPEGLVPKQVEGHIKLEDIHFRYPTRPGVRVLRGLDITIKPGTYVALVGASGCGKSTVIQLLERFYDPLVGKVYLDGQDISTLNVLEYRKHIALVSQEPTLYAGTIKFNILLGAVKPESEVTQEELEMACRNANILDFIRSLPQGFDTEVGGKGSQLSGGQKQRIAIARALLRNPKVLLLDEATSALDSNSEKIVQEALDVAAKGRTTIAIAHRLSTIQNADCIYFIKDGQVSEAGTHDELLSLRGGYFEFVQLQALSKK